VGIRLMRGIVEEWVRRGGEGGSDGVGGRGGADKGTA